MAPAAAGAGGPAGPTGGAQPVVDDGGLLRVRLDLAYDGAGFHGWARQPGLRTVQGEVERALGRALRVAAPATTAAGRTDAGVHARGQVAHADVPAVAWASAAGSDAGSDAAPGGTGPARGPGALLGRLARALPPDLRAAALRPAPAGFDARFSALSRRYAYRLCDDPRGPDPLRRRHVLAVRTPLDAAAMDAAGRGLLGEHDFAAYCRPRPDASTVRRLLALSCTRGPDGLVVLDVEADAFCHSMVRALTGALLAVGAGRRDPGWPARVLAAGRRDPAVAVAPAHGLVLEEVRYPGDDALADRARIARSRRAPARGVPGSQEPG